MAQPYAVPNKAHLHQLVEDPRPIWIGPGQLAFKLVWVEKKAAYQYHPYVPEVRLDQDLDQEYPKRPLGPDQNFSYFFHNLLQPDLQLTPFLHRCSSTWVLGVGWSQWEGPET
eukprot:1140421-Pelagomonas_calceolata.AAC.3